MADLTKEDIANKLKGIERYNPVHIDILTEYLDAQCKNNSYDLEANQAILKLFQFNPTLFRSEVVEKILLKALTNLPHPDFILCELLIDSSKLNQGNIQEIIEMHRRLELCQFKAFWAELAKQKDLYKDIEGFEDSIRNFACHIVGITYQNIRVPLLKDILGYQDKDAEFNSLLKKREWKLSDGDYVLVANQEDKIKTINITEKIELEQVANILATYR
jgi:translation initiation factor 3 subunit K